jgi:hypothetical protein
MYETFKLALSYGIRGEYGISHEMTNTLGTRLIMDVAFYFIVLAILRHIFFAIIVDTFGKLRELKFERDMHMLNSCFVCGIERYDFDKICLVGKSHGFSNHRNITHNPINYLFFIMNIWQQSRDQDNGVEMFVRNCIANDDINWFPIGVSDEDIALQDTAINDDTKKTNSVSNNHGGNSLNHGSSRGDHVKRLDNNHSKVENDLSEKISQISRQLGKLTEKSKINKGDTRSRPRTDSNYLNEKIESESCASPGFNAPAPLSLKNIENDSKFVKKEDFEILLSSMSEISKSVQNVSSRLDKWDNNGSSNIIGKIDNSVNLNAKVTSIENDIDDDFVKDDDDDDDEDYEKESNRLTNNYSRPNSGLSQRTISKNIRAPIQKSPARNKATRPWSATLSSKNSIATDSNRPRSGVASRKPLNSSNLFRPTFKFKGPSQELVQEDIDDNNCFNED